MFLPHVDCATSPRPCRGGPSNLSSTFSTFLLTLGQKKDIFQQEAGA